MPYVHLYKKPNLELPSCPIEIKFLNKNKHDYESFFLKELKAIWIERFVLVRTYQWFRIPNHWEEPWEITPYDEPWSVIWDFRRRSTMPAVKDNNKEHPTTVHMKVAEGISALAPSVESAVVDAIVDREKKRRSTAIVQVWDKLEEKRNELKKIRPKYARYDGNGKGVGEPDFSKEEDDKIKKLKEQISKHEGAINKALEKGDYSDAYNLSSGKDTPESPAETQ